MYLPTLTEKAITVKGQTSFCGLHCNPTAALGYFTDDMNVTCTQYPMVTVRPPRGVVAKPVGMGSVTEAVVIEDRLCVVDGSAVWIGETRLDMGLVSGRKLLVPYSYYLCIWPDKVYVNVLNPEDRGDMTDRAYLLDKDPLFSTDGLSIAVVGLINDQICFPVESTEEPEAPEDGFTDGYLWFRPRHEDDAGETVEAKLYKYAQDVGGFVETEAYLRFSAYTNPEIAKAEHPAIAEGEAIVLEELVAHADEASTATVEEIDALNGVHMVEKVEQGDDRIESFLVRGIISERLVILYDAMAVTVKRAVPEMDYAVAYDGRLYGAYRGVSALSGETVNEIYISAAGDFRRFYRSEDTTADPIVMSVVEPGAFRGAAIVGGVVTFFKDRRILTVGGSTPDSFYISAYDGQGPAEGCEGSLTLLGGYAYYLTAGGDVLRYYGGEVTVCSASLGNRLSGVSTAIGGRVGSSYYICTVKDGIQELFVCDTRSGYWNREAVPDGGVSGMTQATHGLYMTDGYGALWTIAEHAGIHAEMGAEIPEEETRIPWMCESGLIGLDTPEKKYILKVEVRLMIAEGATAEMFVQYDSRTEWVSVWRAEAGETRTVTTRMLPHRCDHMRFRLEGEGAVTVLGLYYTMTKEAGR